MTPPPEIDMLGEQIMTMLSQETSYSSTDYLSMNRLHSCSPKQNRACSMVDEYCREQICEWTYRVVDYFRIDREVAVVSLNYLDRLMCMCTSNRSMYKLAATTTLLMAVKVVHPQKIGELGILSDLSRGEFDMKHVANMESQILKGLKWKLHPPTAAAFTALLLDYIKVKLPPTELDDLYVNANFFAELSVCDYYFVTMRSSTIALASVLNAMEGMMHDADSMMLHKIRRLYIPTRDLCAARNRLWDLYERSEEFALHNDLRTYKPASAIQTSPLQIDDNIKSFTHMSSPVSVSSDRCHVVPEVTDSWPEERDQIRNGSW
eukprot:CAMPEP_0194185744 /NCGR_PEP_ID=MMETSP0154-20130528/44031_1 /TAXON_ID=1049557 /ORGANISM="Thalassiothrix antarctica, Strain L6-D1" /LENGTH=319 /DNA_ID=CAMNT_0038904313 /DNA_START=123 /DNA_END=1082 /DNA_ORIENTATION=-